MGAILLLLLAWPGAAFRVGTPKVVPVRRHLGGRGGGATCARVAPRQAALLPLLEPALGALDTFLRTKPYEAAFVTCAIKAFLADAIAQFQVEKAERLSVRRSLAFVFYGSMYQGVAQYVIFNKVYPAMFGHGHDWVTIFSEVLFDQVVTTPLLCLPIAYLVKAVVFQYPLREGLRRYVADARRDLLAKYWGIWTPVMTITFAVVPEYLRVPFVACFSFFWLILLSNISSRREQAANNLCTSVASLSSRDACSVIFDDDSGGGLLKAGDNKPRPAFATAAVGRHPFDK